MQRTHYPPPPCTNFMREGRCRFGQNCRYSHDLPQQQRTVCQKYMEGSCRYGSNCRYRHPPENITYSWDQTFKPPSVPPFPYFNYNKGFALSANAKPFVPRSQSEAGTSDKAKQQKNDAEEAFCPYFTETGHCSEYDCPLIHCKFCEMCCRYCLNPKDEEQQKMHKKECLNEHEKEMKKAFAHQLSSEKVCGICMENVLDQTQRFGILNKCKHCYCLRCIRSWRKATGPMQKETTRSCPQCRVISDFVIPSTFWVEDDADKQELINTYHANMKEKVCKYMRNGDPNECPFGNKCFYKHQLPDGRVVASGPPRRRRRSPRDYYNLSLEEFISAVPNVNLIRIGVGDEDSVGHLFENFAELFGSEFHSGSFYLNDSDSDYEPPTDDEEDETDVIDDDLPFEFVINQDSDDQE
ncbi:RING-type E3 ubiquitin transferase [Aphelenchoides bicaudatus]|nr:RING-type E3 ubiquitin transferase [Aphelenchoides bicaudatus]